MLMGLLQPLRHPGEDRARIIQALPDSEYLLFYTQILGPLISGLWSPGLTQCNLQFSSESIILSLSTSQGFGLGLNCIAGFPVLQCLHHPLCGSAYACVHAWLHVWLHVQRIEFRATYTLAKHMLYFSPAVSFFSWLFTVLKPVFLFPFDHSAFFEMSKVDWTFQNHTSDYIGSFPNRKEHKVLASNPKNPEPSSHNCYFKSNIALTEDCVSYTV